MDTIIISVKARHIRNMELGIKKYELRKTRPAKCKPYRVVICQSGSGGEVVAEFVSRVFPELSGVDEMKLAKLACITRAEVQGYRQKGKGQLFGWRVEDFKSLKGQGLHVTDFGIDRPPQSWCYGKDRGGQASPLRLTGEEREK